MELRMCTGPCDGLNYILNDRDELCEVCKSNLDRKNKPMIDKNKNMVENDLLPILRNLSPAILEDLTKKKFSFDLLHLRLSLLVRQGGDIRDEKGHLRYYVDSYNINGEKYHICSQWWSATGNDSKDVLKLLKHLDIGKLV